MEDFSITNLSGPDHGRVAEAMYPAYSTTEVEPTLYFGISTTEMHPTMHTGISPMEDNSIISTTEVEPTAYSGISTAEVGPATEDALIAQNEPNIEDCDAMATDMEMDLGIPHGMLMELFDNLPDELKDVDLGGVEDIVGVNDGVEESPVTQNDSYRPVSEDITKHSSLSSQTEQVPTGKPSQSSNGSAQEQEVRLHQIEQDRLLAETIGAERRRRRQPKRQQPCGEKNIDNILEEFKKEKKSRKVSNDTGTGSTKKAKRSQPSARSEHRSSTLASMKEEAMKNNLIRPCSVLLKDIFLDRKNQDVMKYFANNGGAVKHATEREKEKKRKCEEEQKQEHKRQKIDKNYECHVCGKLYARHAFLLKHVMKH